MGALSRASSSNQPSPPGRESDAGVGHPFSNNGVVSVWATLDFGCPHMNKSVNVHQETLEEAEKEPSARGEDNSKSDDSWHSDVSVNEMSISNLNTTADWEKKKEERPRESVEVLARGRGQAKGHGGAH